MGGASKVWTGEGAGGSTGGGGGGGAMATGAGGVGAGVLGVETEGVGVWRVVEELLVAVGAVGLVAEEFDCSLDLVPAFVYQLWYNLEHAYIYI